MSASIHDSRFIMGRTPNSRNLFSIVVSCSSGPRGAQKRAKPKWLLSSRPSVQENVEQGWRDGGFLLVTQNIDDLHERGGSKNVLHMHGEINKIKCVSCYHEETTMEATTVDTACQKCTLPMRPDVVWFGEMPYHLDVIEMVLERADIFISIGTSGQVMPASLFARTVRMDNPNAEIIEVNPNPTGDSSFNRVIAEAASVAIPKLVDQLLADYQR